MNMLQQWDPRRHSCHRWEPSDDCSISQETINVIAGVPKDHDNMARVEGSGLPLTKTP